MKIYIIYYIFINAFLFTFFLNFKIKILKYKALFILKNKVILFKFSFLSLKKIL